MGNKLFNCCTGRNMVNSDEDKNKHYLSSNTSNTTSRNKIRNSKSLNIRIRKKYRSENDDEYDNKKKKISNCLKKLYHKEELAYENDINKEINKEINRHFRYVKENE